ncbi:MAG: hypothetical protein NVS9B10_04140 [Nevskia sp.]
MALPIIDALRRRFDSAATRALELAGRDAFSLSAEIPGFTPEQPLWRIKVEMLSEEQGDGGRMRLRAHLQSHLASALAKELPSSSKREALGGPDGGQLPVARVAQSLRLGLKVPALRRLAAPLLRHDLNSWIELRASTADLVDGARALLPESEQLKALGIDTAAAAKSDDDGPVMQTWAGATGGRYPGFAQVSLLHIDKRHLPKSLSALLGGRPFQLVAAVINVAEEKAI